MYMQTIMHRELRNNSAAILHRVQAGETFEITNNGEPVAILSPISQDRLSIPKPYWTIFAGNNERLLPRYLRGLEAPH